MFLCLPKEKYGITEYIIITNYCIFITLGFIYNIRIILQQNHHFSNVESHMLSLNIIFIYIANKHVTYHFFFEICNVRELSNHHCINSHTISSVIKFVHQFLRNTCDLWNILLLMIILMFTLEHSTGHMLKRSIISTQFNQFWKPCSWLYKILFYLSLPTPFPSVPIFFGRRNSYLDR